jgi:hypothetical protein
MRHRPSKAYSDDFGWMIDEIKPGIFKDKYFNRGTSTI